MGTRSFQLFVFFLINTKQYLHAHQQTIILNSLFTHSSYPSIEFALEQIRSSSMDIQLELNNSSEHVIPVGIHIAT